MRVGVAADAAVDEGSDAHLKRAAECRGHGGSDDTGLILPIHTGTHFGIGAGAEEDSLGIVRQFEAQVIAPAQFIEEAASENILAGAAMGRRAQYQFGMRSSNLALLRERLAALNLQHNWSENP